MEQIILKLFSENGFITATAIAVFIILTSIIRQIMKQQEKNTLRAEKREDDYVEIIKELKTGMQNLLDEIKTFRNESSTAHKFNKQDFKEIKEAIVKEETENKEEHQRLENILEKIAHKGVNHA